MLDGTLHRGETDRKLCCDRLGIQNNAKRNDVIETFQENETRKQTKS